MAYHCKMSLPFFSEGSQHPGYDCDVSKWSDCSSPDGLMPLRSAILLHPSGHLCMLTHEGTPMMSLQAVVQAHFITL